MKRLRVVVVGYGRLGSICCRAILASDDLALAGIVRRPDSLGGRLPDALRDVRVVASAAEVEAPEVALLCLPPHRIVDAAHELLQHRVSVVECAALHGDELRAHADTIGRFAVRYRTAAVVGAGWDPGLLSVLRAVFGLLVPKGHSQTRHCPGAALHHTTAVRNIRGVTDAVAAELTTADGREQRYLYVELAPGALADDVAAAIRADPLFMDRETLVVPVESVAALEHEGRGIVLERWGGSAVTSHQRLLLEARIDQAGLAAQTMLAAARAVRLQPPGAYTLIDVPLRSLWGPRNQARAEQWL